MFDAGPGSKQSNGTMTLSSQQTGQAYLMPSPGILQSPFTPNTVRPLLMSVYSPDLSLRQPLTLATILPLLLSYHALAVLAVLPNTFIFKQMLLPFVLWQAWKCSTEFEWGVPLAQLLGHQGTDRIAFWNFLFVVRFPRS